MYQRFIAVGRLGRDPELVTTPSGAKMATVTLATSEYVKGEERTEWHRVVIWDEKLIEVLMRRGKKGTLLAVEGQVRSRRYQQKDGREVQTTEIVLDRFNSRLQVLGNGKTDEERSTAAEPEAQPARRGGRVEREPALEFEDEEIPF
jgi:single-strand DNA-binding protein